MYNKINTLNIKKIYIYIIIILLNINYSYAENGLLEWVWNPRTWDIHSEDIPIIIWNAIDYFMWIAWGIAILFIIIWAYKILFWSLTWDKSKWKETIFAALVWFTLAATSWLIMSFIIENFNA